MWELLNVPDFISADLHAIVQVEQDKENFVLKTHKGLNFKNS